MNHFFEALEQDINFQNEYIKLEYMLICERDHRDSVENWLKANFREWKERKNYIDFHELRAHLGFDYTIENDSHVIFAKDIDINKYFLYCEMLINLFDGLSNEFRSSFVDKQIKDVISTMDPVIEKCGFCIEEIDKHWMIIEKNPVAVEVSDHVPELANVIIEYNHHLLKGDLNRKKAILIEIARALEPKRPELKRICNTMTEDFFQLVNKMDIRHNNQDPTDKGNYNVTFAKLNTDEQESWYDLLYEQALALYVMLDQVERTKKINQFKQSM